ncbi:MAG: hypothetical protein ACI8QS_000863 [Planctomycetota bacterium]|jgi:hypothetical protein
METLTFEDLCTLEPRLRELEVRMAAVGDPGSGTFFCSNFVWLPLNADLRDLVGTARRRSMDADGGTNLSEEDLRCLYSSVCYETAYIVLSKLLPPCRDCGCRLFEPFQKAQVGEAVKHGKRSVSS